MPTSDEIDDAITDSLSRPKRIRQGQNEIEEHSLADLQKLAQSTAATGAATKPGAGLRFQQITPVYR